MFNRVKCEQEEDIILPVKTEETAPCIQQKNTFGLRFDCVARQKPHLVTSAHKVKDDMYILL